MGSGKLTRKERARNRMWRTGESYEEAMAAVIKASEAAEVANNLEMQRLHMDAIENRRQRELEETKIFPVPHSVKAILSGLPDSNRKRH